MEAGRGTYPKRKVMKCLGRSGFWGSLRKDNLPRQEPPRSLNHSSSSILGGRFLLRPVLGFHALHLQLPLEHLGPPASEPSPEFQDPAVNIIAFFVLQDIRCLGVPVTYLEV